MEVQQVFGIRDTGSSSNETTPCLNGGQVCGDLDLVSSDVQMVSDVNEVKVDPEPEKKYMADIVTVNNAIRATEVDDPNKIICNYPRRDLQEMMSNDDVGASEVDDPNKIICNYPQRDLQDVNMDIAGSKLVLRVGKERGIRFDLNRFTNIRAIEQGQGFLDYASFLKLQKIRDFQYQTPHPGQKHLDRTKFKGTRGDDYNHLITNEVPLPMAWRSTYLDKKTGKIELSYRYFQMTFTQLREWCTRVVKEQQRLQIIVLGDGNPVAAYWDLDAGGSSDTPNKKQMARAILQDSNGLLKSIVQFESFLREFCQKYGFGDPFGCGKCLWFEAGKDGKLSLHCHLPGLAFKDSRHHSRFNQAFMRFLEAEADADPAKMMLCKKDDQGKWDHLIDDTVYSEYRNFRMWNQCKPGGPALRYLSGPTPVVLQQQQQQDTPIAEIKMEDLIYACLPNHSIDTNAILLEMPDTVVENNRKRKHSSAPQVGGATAKSHKREQAESKDESKELEPILSRLEYSSLKQVIDVLKILQEARCSKEFVRQKVWTRYNPPASLENSLRGISSEDPPNQSLLFDRVWNQVETTSDFGKALSIVQTYAKDNFTIKAVPPIEAAHSAYKLLRAKECFCVICNRPHDGDNQEVLWLKNNIIEMRCRRDGLKTGHPIGTLQRSSSDNLSAKEQLQKILHQQVANSVANSANLMIGQSDQDFDVVLGDDFPEQAEEDFDISHFNNSDDDEICCDPAEQEYSTIYTEESAIDWNKLEELDSQWHQENSHLKYGREGETKQEKAVRNEKLAKAVIQKEKQLIKEMNQFFFAVTGIEKPIIVQRSVRYDSESETYQPEKVLYEPRTLEATFVNRKVTHYIRGKWVEIPLIKLWKGSKYRAEYVKFTMNPNIEQFKEHNRCRKCPWFNLFNGFTITKERAAKFIQQIGAQECKKHLELWKSHVLNIICGGDATQAEYLNKWLAKMLQKPWLRPGVAIVFNNKAEGAGAGAFFEKIEEIVGRTHSYHAQGADSLTDNFNSQFTNAIWFFADEALYSGSKAADSKVKPFITEKTLEVNGKYTAKFRVPFFGHVLIASNEDAAVSANYGSRRYFSTDISDRFAGILTAEKRKYWEDYRAIPAEVIADYYYTEVDIEKYEPREAIPASKKARSLKRLGLDPITSWWEDCLHKGYISVKFNIYRNRNNTSSDNSTSMGLDEFRPFPREGENAWTRGYYKESIYECFRDSVSWADKRYMKDSAFWIKMRKLVPSKDELDQANNLQTYDNEPTEEVLQSSPKMIFPRYKRITNCEGNDIRPWCVYFPPLDFCRQWYKENVMYDPDYRGFDDNNDDNNNNNNTNGGGMLGFQLIDDTLLDLTMHL